MVETVEVVPVRPVAETLAMAPTVDRTVTNSRRRGAALLAGAATSLGASVGLQLLAFTLVKERCLAPASSDVSACIAGEPGIVATGALGALFSVSSVGLGAGGGWELGTGRRSGRALQVAGALVLGMGLSAVVGSRVARLGGPACEDANCAADQRLLDLGIRSAGTLLVAGGGAMLSAHARARRPMLVPTRYAGGFGLALVVQW